uniref:C2H2-type domain-containing protein n=1 Tax=Lutzomyia longipalpis TaxID=7200 RepID=A0A1B0CY13_LUTLO
MELINGKSCRTCLSNGIPLTSLDVKLFDGIDGESMLNFLLGSSRKVKKDFFWICVPCRKNLISSYCYKLQCLESEEKIFQEFCQFTSPPDAACETSQEPTMLSPSKEDENDTRASVEDPEEFPDTNEPESFFLEDLDKKSTAQEKILKYWLCRKCDLLFPERQGYDRHKCEQSRDHLSYAKHCQEHSHSEESQKIIQGCKSSEEEVQSPKPRSLKKTQPTFRTRTSGEGQAGKSSSEKLPDTKKISIGLSNTADVISCPKCFATFPDKDSRRKHYSREHLLPPRKRTTTVCEDCGKTVQTRYLRSHKITHREKSFFCAFCGAGFISKERLKMHIRIHTKEETYICPYCNRGFVHWGTRRDHIRSVHEGNADNFKNYKCDLCDQKYRKKFHLDVHMRKHTGEKPYQCPQCEKRYRYKNGLKEHLVSHTNEKNMICTICSKSFALRKYLMQHMVTHSEVRKHVCDICNRGFTQKHVLKSHRRANHPDHPELLPK